MPFFVELGIANVLYRACYVLGFIAIFIFNTFYGKKYQIKPAKALGFTVISYVIIFLWSFVLAWVMNGFQWGHHNAIRVYIWMPLVLWLMGKAFKIDWRTACDYIAPSTCIVYGIARLGCVFAGCCYGIPSKIGLYSVQAGHVCFPVQLCQAITSLIIAAIIIALAKKQNYEVTGKLYPIMLIMYGFSRFIWEFFSDSEKNFIGLTELAIWSVATFTMGVLWLVIKKVKENKQAENR